MFAKGPQVSRSYEFGPFVLNATEHLLTANGTPVSLPPRAFDLLVVLVENNGSLTTKDDLLKLVWHDAEVEEGNIPYNVSLVRKALKDDASAPRYVATVSKLGYRFIAQVTSPSECANSSRPIKTTFENNGRSGQETPFDLTGVRLHPSPLKSHPWHLLAVCVLYSLYYSVAFMLEVAYEYGAYQKRARAIVPVIFGWIMTTSLVGLWGGLKLTSRGARFGILFSLCIFIGAALILYLALGLFLPNSPITLASFQVYPAHGAFLKTIYYVLPLVVLFIVLPFHSIVAIERELMNEKSVTSLKLIPNSPSRVSVLGIPHIRTWWLAGTLLAAFCVALLGTAHLVDNLQSSPNSGLFIQLAQWRLLLYFLLGLESVLWYQQAQQSTSQQG
jgi:DNA-binding winged helix-turn-helix (wHTH) protein